MQQSVLKILWCLAFAVVANLGHPATIITTQPGNWFTDTNNDPLAWAAQVPGPGDDVLLTNSVTFNGIANGVSVVQDLDIGPGGALYLNSGQLQVQGTNSLWTAGSVAYGGDPASGPLLLAGNLTISGLQDFYLAGLPTGGLDTVLINSGTIVQTNTGSVSVSGAYVINLNNATYEIKSDAGIYWVSGNGAGIENSGLFLKSGGTGTSVINIDFANTNGTQSVQSGTLRYVRSYSSINGIFNIGSGASLVVANGAGLISNGVFNINSAGAINLTAGGNSPPLKGLFTGSGTGFFEFSSGTLSAETPCTFDFPAGFFHWTGGALTWPGNGLTNLGEIDIDGTNIATLANNSILVNQGTMLQNNVGALSMDWSSTLHNLPGGTYEFQSDSGIVVGGGNPGRSIVNEGLFRKTAGTGQSIIQVLFDNLGGTVEVDSGALVLSGGGTSSNGTYQVSSAAELLVASGTVNGATFQSAAGGLIDLTGGAAGPTYSGLLTGTGGGTLQISNGTFFARGCTLNFPTNLLVWTGGTIDVDGSVLTNQGFVTVNTTSNSIVDGGEGFALGGSWVNSGTVMQLNSGSLGLGWVTHFTNTVSGLYDLQGDGGISDNSNGNGGNAVDNAGLFRKSQGTGISVVGVPFNSYNGTVEVNSGHLILAAGGMMNTATYNVAPNGVLDITGGSTATYSGFFTGSGGGTVLLASGTVAAQVPCNFNFPSNLFQWTGGTIDVTGSALTNLGIINASTTSNNFLNGNFPGGSLVNLNRFVQNNLGSLGLGRNTRFTNAAGGFYDLQSDAGISDGSGGWGGNAVDNVGTFRKSSGKGVSLIGVPFNNYGGTIEVDSGQINLAAGGKLNDAVFNVGVGAILDVTGGGLTPTWNGTLTGTGVGTVLLAGATVNARVPCNFNFPSNLFQWVGGTINVTGNSATNLGFMTVNTVSNSILDGTYPGGRLINLGTFLQLNNGNLGLGRLTVFTNSASGVYDFNGDGGVADTSGGWGGNEFDNSGLVVKSSGTNTSSFGVPYKSHGGELEIDSGVVALTAGNYDQNGGKLLVHLGGRNQGEFGTLSVTGTASLSGTLQAALGNGFKPSVGDQFQILACSSLMGTFESLQLPSGFVVAYSSNAVTLVLGPPNAGEPVNPTLAGGSFSFLVPGVTGLSYSVLTNAELSGTNWALYTNFVSDGFPTPVVAPINGCRALFFRIGQP